MTLKQKKSIREEKKTNVTEVCKLGDKFVLGRTSSSGSSEATGNHIKTHKW